MISLGHRSFGPLSSYGQHTVTCSPGGDTARQLLFVEDGVSHGLGYKLKLACLIRENASFSCPEGALCSHCSQDSDPGWGSSGKTSRPWKLFIT